MTTLPRVTLAEVNFSLFLCIIKQLAVYIRIANPSRGWEAGRVVYKGLFTCREGAPANWPTRLEGLTHSPPLRATHLTGTVSGLRGLTFEWPLNTKTKWPTKETFFHLIPASCTDMDLFSARGSSLTLISSD